MRLCFVFSESRIIMRDMKTSLKVFSLLAVVAVIGAVPFALDNASMPSSVLSPKSVEYLCIVDPEEMQNGDFYTNAGTRLHFNEDGVTESWYLEIAPLGGLYLTTPINGLKNVEINLYNYQDQFTFAWCSAPYEAMDVYDGGGPDARHYDFSTTNSDNLPPRYFSITNPSSTKSIRINSIAIRYSCESDYDGIVSEPLVSSTSAYDEIFIDKTLKWGDNIDAEIAHVDFFDRGYYENDVFRIPGSYPVAYTVYSASEDHSFQYSTLASYTVKGMESGNHAVTFHDSYEHAHGEVFEVAKGHNFTGQYPTHFIWDAPINDFTNVTEDRHYYPVMNAFGFDPNGHCSPVTANWYLNECHVEMPAPDRVDEGYQFVGWFIDAQCNRPYDKHETKQSNLTLYAKVIPSSYPIRPVYYYDVDRDLLSVDYVVLDHVKGDSRYGNYTVGRLYDHGFYYNASDEAGYCTTGDVITIDDKKGPVTILNIDDQNIVNNRDYHVEYRSETVTSDTFYTVTHFSDRKGYREVYDPIGRVDEPLSPLAFHIPDGETFKTIVSTDGYIYPYARRNTYLDDLDALTEIGPYAYACYGSHSAKPLYGLSGHNRVTKVGRRAFFNRFGLADHATYFPPNAAIFDTEAYANVFFNNGIIILPNSLQKIGARCFMGSQNVNRIYLPLSLTSVGSNAFAVGTFNEEIDEFVNIHDSPRIDFYYQGSEEQFNALPATTKQRILNNSRSITYNVELHMHTPTDYLYVCDWPYTQKYLPEENL